MPRRQDLTHAFRALHSRNYRLFWGGQLISQAGTWMQDVALSWLVVILTESPEALGLTMTIRFLPALLFSLHGGVLADRLPKRRTLIVTQSTHLFVALALAVLTSTDAITVVLIYTLAGVRGLVDAIEGPARQAFVPEMVGREDLQNAVALNSTLFNAARIAGPAVGAVVISALGGGADAIAACFYINVVTYIAVVAALFAMRASELHVFPRAPHGDSFRQLREGFRYARSVPEIMAIFIVMGTIGAFGLNLQTMLPLITKWVLNAGASTLSLLTTSMGVGSVVAGLFLAYRGKPSLRLIFGGAAAFVVLLALMGLTGSKALMAVLLFAAGVMAVLFMTTANTRLQTLAPDHLRGRVMGIYILLFIGTTPIGSYLIGALAEYLPMRADWRVRTTILIMAGLSAAGVIAGVTYALRARKGSGAQPEPDPALIEGPSGWDLKQGGAVKHGLGDDSSAA